MIEVKAANCVKCGIFKCHHPGYDGKFPSFCPRQNYSKVREETLKKNWIDPENVKVNLAWENIMERDKDELGYKWTRVREVIEYAKVLSYRKIGIAFCIGLREEAKILANILEKNGFEVVSVVCTAGGVKKEELGEDKVLHPMVCNPIMQAEVLNRERTELNIMFGLCVGHDVLFLRHSKADVTPLVVKDRIMCHNPLGAIYLSNTYYRQKLFPS